MKVTLVQCIIQQILVLVVSQFHIYIFNQGIIKYEQFSCIFCSIFLYYFSLEVAQEVSNDGLMSFMGISPFLSLIYHIECSLLTDFFHTFLYKPVSSVARCSHVAREAGVPFPTGTYQAFSFVSNLNSRHQWTSPQIPICKGHL